MEGEGDELCRAAEALSEREGQGQGEEPGCGECGGSDDYKF